MAKKVKETRFVQLGLTRNGKIGKNERYSLDKFAELLFPDLEGIKKPKVPKELNWKEKLSFSKRKAYQEKVKKYHVSLRLHIISETLKADIGLNKIRVTTIINELINRDTFGKKKGSPKTSPKKKGAKKGKV